MTATAPAVRPRTRRGVHPRVILVVLGGLCLLSGLDAALLLARVPAPVTAQHLEGAHGMIMVLGFMGTLISLERAQALGQGWAYLAPAVLGAGGIALGAGLPVVLGRLLLVNGAVLLLVVYLALWRRAPLPVVAVQALSALLAAAAAGLWLVIELPALIALLACFLILTIAAERAELAQLVLGPRAVPTLIGLAVALTAGALATLLAPAPGARLFGAGVLATAGWLIRDDAPRRLLRTTTGLRRFNAVALLAGYGWLAIAGLVWLIGGTPVGGAYDAVIHATFLGFGVSMIMAHAPIIFPAVLARPLPYHRVLWVPLSILHLGMAVRVAMDLTGGSGQGPWQVGSVMTVASLLVFAATVVTLVVRG